VHYCTKHSWGGWHEYYNTYYYYIVIIIVVATESHEYIIIVALDEYAQAYEFVVMPTMTEYIVTWWAQENSAPYVYARTFRPYNRGAVHPQRLSRAVTVQRRDGRTRYAQITFYRRLCCC